MAQFAPVARQSIPRSDLYGDLGVDPSADAIAIEAAYRELIDRLAQSEAAKDVRRAARLRLAHEWLTDPERRSRFDASRAKAAARAERAADVEAREFAGSDVEAGESAAVEPGETEADADTIPWPSRDLQRSAGIQWSSTPDGLADDEPAKRRRSRLPMGALGLLALAVVVFVGTYLVATNLRSTNVANGNPTASPPAQTVAPPTASAPPEPSVAPSVEPTTVPTPGASPVPAELVAMQQSAWATIQSLQAAAATGDVAAAQVILGSGAPGLRASGLRRATFPTVAAGEIGVQREGELYVALAGDGRLTSVDGLTWTFDYGDRPLAAYKSPGAEPVHDLWWGESDGEHHLFLQVTVATISRTGVTANVKWSFDPSRPDDAAYFRLAGLVISTVALDGVDVPVTDESVLISGATKLTLDGTFDVEAAVASQVLLGLTVANPRSLGGDPRLIDTGWTLAVR